MKTYLIPKVIFVKIKPSLNGWIFWKKNGNMVEIKTYHKSIQRYLDKFKTS